MIRDVSPATLFRIASQLVAQTRQGLEDGGRRQHCSELRLVRQSKFQDGPDIGRLKIAVHERLRKAERATGQNPQHGAGIPDAQNGVRPGLFPDRHMFPVALELERQASDGDAIGPAAHHALPEGKAAHDRLHFLFGMTHDLMTPFCTTIVDAILAAAGLCR